MATKRINSPLNLRELGPEDSSGGSLQAHGEDRDCDDRRVGHEQVYMIGLPVELAEFATKASTDAGEGLLETGELPVAKHLAAVLHHEHEVDMKLLAESAPRRRSVVDMHLSVTPSWHGMDMARSGHKKAPRRNPPANEGRRYRLYPTATADEVMTGWGHTRRAIRNLGLEQRITAWRYAKKTVRSFAQSHDLTELRQEYDWVRALPAQAAQRALADVDAAYENFFSGRSRFPTFEKRSATLRFSLPGQALEVRRLNRHWGEVRIPKLGWQRFRMSRALGGLSTAAHIVVCVSR